MSQVVSKNLYYEDTNVAVVKTCIVCGRIRTYACVNPYANAYVVQYADAYVKLVEYADAYVVVNV
jgi:hypothetical protein